MAAATAPPPSVAERDGELVGHVDALAHRLPARHPLRACGNRRSARKKGVLFQLIARLTLPEKKNAWCNMVPQSYHVVARRVMCALREYCSVRKHKPAHAGTPIGTFGPGGGV